MTSVPQLCGILEAVILNEPVSIDTITKQVGGARMDVAMTVLELDRHRWVRVGVDGVSIGDRLGMILDNRVRS